jgi:hypothetical protein
MDLKTFFRCRGSRWGWNTLNATGGIKGIDKRYINLRACFPCAVNDPLANQLYILVGQRRSAILWTGSSFAGSQIYIQSKTVVDLTEQKTLIRVAGKNNLIPFGR